MRRSYKFLLRPTGNQARALEACLEDTRQLYNAALEERREAWRMGRHFITFNSQDSQLKDIRSADPGRYERWAYTCERAALRRLDRAFQAFYRRCKTGEKPGYPRFKGKSRWDSLEWQIDCGARWNTVPHPTVTRVYFKGIGHVRVHQHRPIQGRIKTITAKRQAGRWYVVLSCDDVPTQPMEPTGAVVGIDMGVASLLTTSDGQRVPNPRPLTAVTKQIADVQQSLKHKKRGSARHRKVSRKVAALHAKAHRVRRDHAHKAALALVRDHDVIVHEDLRINSMVRRPKPRPVADGSFAPNRAVYKAGLNRSINDAGWGSFLGILHAKAESAGRVVIEVAPYRTSQRCAVCGHVAAGNRATQAGFRCLACGHAAHADVNAAINILRAGLALQEQAA